VALLVEAPGVGPLHEEDLAEVDERVEKEDLALEASNAEIQLEAIDGSRSRGQDRLEILQAGAPGGEVERRGRRELVQQLASGLEVFPGDREEGPVPIARRTSHAPEERAAVLEEPVERDLRFRVEARGRSGNPRGRVALGRAPRGHARRPEDQRVGPRAPVRGRRGPTGRLRLGNLPRAIGDQP
jgi:hypothetical protein